MKAVAYRMPLAITNAQAAAGRTTARFWDIAVAAVGESSHMARSNRTAVISLDLAIKPECVEAPHYSCPATDA